MSDARAAASLPGGVPGCRRWKWTSRRVCRLKMCGRHCWISPTGGPEIWPGIEPSLYEVYTIGDTFADVQEGSKMPGAKIWAKEHYDWSAGGLVTWTVQESNFCAPGSYVSAAIAPRGDGGSRIHLTWNRTPTSLVGRMATALIVLTRGKPVAASFRQALAKLSGHQRLTARRGRSIGGRGARWSRRR